MQLHQRRPASDHELLEVLLRGLDLLVDDIELTDQLDREPPPGLPDEVARLDRLVGGQELLCPGREKLQPAG